MNPKNSSLPFLSFVITMVSFVYFIIVQLAGNVPINLATWVLWMIVDASLLFVMIKGGEKRPWLMIDFTSGATTLALIALVKFASDRGECSWGTTETLAAVATLGALMVWRFTGTNAGIIAITAAMYIAMVPSLRNAWMHPVGQDPFFWPVGVVTCSLTYFGSSKTIAGRFMPAVGTIFNGLMTLLVLRQFFL